MSYHVKQYEPQYRETYEQLIRLLWSDIESHEISDIIAMSLRTDDKVFVALKNSTIVGFLNSSIRTDYVEGSTGNRIGYIEGIYVIKEERNNGVASLLVQGLHKYYKNLGITEIGSDSLIDNEESFHFHKSIGFKEVSVCRHYIMKVED